MSRRKRRDSKGWYLRKDAVESYYTLYPRRETIYHIAGPGDRTPTPQEMVEVLNKHPDASICRASGLIYEYDNEVVAEKAVSLPSGCYRYEEATHLLPERIVSFELRTDTIIKMPGITRHAVEDVRRFLASEQVYRDVGIQYRRGILLYGAPGQGKCLGKNTPILMYDGSIKMVQDVQVGDLLMGPNSMPRRVITTTTGRERLYRVMPKKGEPFVCNESHILSLTASGLAKQGPNGQIRGQYKNGDIVNIDVRSYLNQSNNFQSHTFLYRVGVEFPEKPVSIDPYMLGYWLGDGDSDKARITTADDEVVQYFDEAVERVGLHLRRYGKSGKAGMYGISTGDNIRPNAIRRALQEYGLFGNKHIPFVYKTNSRKVRLEVLAGLIDSDGFVNDGCYTYSTTIEQLADDAVYLARSLGFAAYKKRLNKTKQKSTHKDAYYVYISGHVSQIPVKVKRKQLPERRQRKNVLHVGFKLEDIGEGSYYGFEIEGPDKLFLLGDFTVTHNTTALREIVKEEIPEDAIVVFTGNLPSMAMIKKLQEEEKHRLKVFVFEELVAMLARHEMDVEELLDFLDGEASLDNCLIFATTNYPERLPGNIVDRPSRFDRLIKVGNPNRDTRHELLKLYLSRDPLEEEVDATEDMSVAAIKEACILSRLHELSFDKAVEVMKKMREVVKDDFKEAKDPIGLSSRPRYIEDDFELPF